MSDPLVHAGMFGLESFADLIPVCPQQCGARHYPNVACEEHFGQHAILASDRNRTRWRQKTAWLLSTWVGDDLLDPLLFLCETAYRLCQLTKAIGKLLLILAGGRSKRCSEVRVGTIGADSGISHDSSPSSVLGNPSVGDPAAPGDGLRDLPGAAPQGGDR